MRTILIIHESQASRILLRKFITSEFSDLLIEDVSSIEDIKNITGVEKFDVILCGRQIIDKAKYDFYNSVRSNEMINGTPIVVVTSDSSADKIQELKQNGVKHILKTPFTPLELRSAITEAGDSRGRRGDTRISIPGTKVRVNLDDYALEGEVINISKSGILCDFTGKRIDPEILNGTDISIIFPYEFNGISLKNITCKFLRLQVLNWDDTMYPDCVPNHIRVVWQIINMSLEDNKTLNVLLEQAGNNLYEMH